MTVKELFDLVDQIRPNAFTEREKLHFIPYTDIYIYYLAAMIDFYNGDAGRYNDTMVLSNTAWNDYAAYYREKHRPKQTNLFGMIPERS